MHQAVLDWVSASFNKWDSDKSALLHIVEFGSLDINGSVRQIFQPYSTKYIGVDPQAGPGVDIQGDASTFGDPELEQMIDIVVCCEVFEHTPIWREIINNAYRLLRSGGLFVATMAGEGRRPHSALDEKPIREWEYYANVGSWELSRAMRVFSRHDIDVLGTDIRTMGVK